MGKKTIVWAYLIVLSLGTILSLYIPKNEVAAKDAIVIPGQAIRLRILANSDLNSDQELKHEVRDKVNAKISLWVKDLTSIKEARKVIDSKLPEIKATAEEVVKQHGSNQAVMVKFGKVQFPTKLYGQFLYPAGDYEAVLITLGKGEGANWWCVLFPPLCFLDFSNGVAVSNGFEEQKANKKPETAKASLPKQEEAQSESRNEQAVIPDQEQSDAKQKAEQSDANSAPSKKGHSDAKQLSSVPDTKQQSSEQDQPVSISESPQPDRHDSSAKKNKKEAPVYTTEDEAPIKVKFFALELWKKLF